MSNFLTAAEAAKVLGCSVAQVKAMCQEGGIVAEKFGHAWLIRPEALAGVTLGKAGRPRKPATP